MFDIREFMSLCAFSDHTPIINKTRRYKQNEKSTHTHLWIEFIQASSISLFDKNYRFETCWNRKEMKRRNDGKKTDDIYATAKQKTNVKLASQVMAGNSFTWHEPKKWKSEARNMIIISDALSVSIASEALLRIH